MAWNELKKAICFEGSEVCIHWHTPINTLVDIGNPEIKQVGGRIEIVWHDTSLIGGIKGDWTISTFPPNNMNQPFKSIHLNYSGDEESNEAYQKSKTHILSLFGKPSLQNESERDKELKWVHQEYYIRLYLFEMHAFRCVLTIGKD